MLVRCTQCKRIRGEKTSESEGISSDLCAKCYAVFYKDDMDDLRDILKIYIEKEESGDVFWNGPEPTYTKDELKTYNEVLAEVRREKDPTGEVRK